MGLQDHRLLTARLFFQPSDDPNGFIDCGNCKSHTFVPIAERAPHMASQKGVRTVDLDLPKLEAVKRTLVLDEHFNETLRLLSIGKQLADVVQATSVAATMTITAGNLVRGRSYELGKLGTSNLTAQTAGAVTLVLGVDYLGRRQRDRDDHRQHEVRQQLGVYVRLRGRDATEFSGAEPAA
jgi:hypothetical protein